MPPVRTRESALRGDHDTELGRFTRGDRTDPKEWLHPWAHRSPKVSPGRSPGAVDGGCNAARRCARSVRGAPRDNDHVVSNGQASLADLATLTTRPGTDTVSHNYLGKPAVAQFFEHMTGPKDFGGVEAEDLGKKVRLGRGGPPRWRRVSIREFNRSTRGHTPGCWPTGPSLGASGQRTELRIVATASVAVQPPAGRGRPGGATHRARPPA